MTDFQKQRYTRINEYLVKKGFMALSFEAIEEYDYLYTDRLQGENLYLHEQAKKLYDTELDIALMILDSNK